MRIDIRLPSAQGEVFKTRLRVRFRLVVCGRRWGKTYFAAVEAIETAVKGGRVWWVAPTHSVGLEGFRMARELLPPLIREG